MSVRTQMPKKVHFKENVNPRHAKTKSHLNGAATGFVTEQKPILKTSKAVNVEQKPSMVPAMAERNSCVMKNSFVGLGSF